MIGNSMAFSKDNSLILMMMIVDVENVRWRVFSVVEIVDRSHRFHRVIVFQWKYNNEIERESSMER